ncbi:DUF883 family protein [Paraburkholderia sp. 5N]|uniref:DUF883 family protein n=1 Tax=Paraburkholderia elongata TaxID=2675747 RepID=A0A972SIM7_9BURK|nr:DUF883 family protein [Paraburkholderia elongata]
MEWEWQIYRARRLRSGLDIRVLLSDSVQSAPTADVVLRLVATRRKQDAKRYVRCNPWRSIGIAAGAGFLLGALSAR